MDHVSTRRKARLERLGYDQPHLHDVLERYVLNDGQCRDVHDMVDVRRGHLRECERNGDFGSHMHNLLERFHNHDKRLELHGVVDLCGRYVR